MRSIRTVVFSCALFPLTVCAVSLVPLAPSVDLTPTTLPTGTPIASASITGHLDTVLNPSPVITFTSQVFQEGTGLTFVYTFSSTQDVVIAGIDISRFSTVSIDAGYVGSTTVPSSIPTDPLTFRPWTSTEVTPRGSRSFNGDTLFFSYFPVLSPSGGYPAGSIVLRTDATTFSADGLFNLEAEFEPAPPLTGDRFATFGANNFSTISFDAIVPEPTCLMAVGMGALALRLRRRERDFLREGLR